jgi:hypothetical protein
MTTSQIISLLTAFGAAILGITVYLEQLDPTYAVLAMMAGTFITIFCKSLTEKKPDKE